MIIGVQILGILFGIFMLYMTYVNYKKNTYTKRSFILWSTIWIAIILIVTIPEIIYGIMNLLSFQRTADFFTSIGILFLTTITFYSYSTVKRNQQKVDKLVRAYAIEKAKEKKR